MGEQVAEAGIKVTTSFPRGSQLRLVRPQLALDDAPPMVVQWGTLLLPVSPGRHKLRCYYRYTLHRHAGNAVIEVQVDPGEVVPVTYQAPFGLLWRAGRWTYADADSM